MYIKEVSLQGSAIWNLHIAPTAGMNLFYGDNAQGKPIFWNPFIFAPWDALSGAEASSSSSPLGRKKAISVWKSCGKTGVTALTFTWNGTRKRYCRQRHSCEENGELFGTLYAVIFSPEDLSLIKDGPAERRRFWIWSWAKSAMCILWPSAVLPCAETAEQSAERNQGEAGFGGYSFRLGWTAYWARRADHGCQSQIFSPSGRNSRPEAWNIDGRQRLP